MVLYRTHKFDEFVRLGWKQLKKQTKNHCILYDATGKPPLAKTNCFNFTIDDYKDSGYPLATPEQWKLLPAYQSRGLGSGVGGQESSSPTPVWEIYFNPEYAVLLYFREHPNFDFYWSIEYDVYFNGNWSVLFDACKEDKSDLLGCYLRKFEDEIPYNPLWNHLNFDATKEQHKICYGPVQRYSKEALQILDKEYQACLHGFGETAVPTILSINGLVCTDINSNGMFYNPQTFGADYIRENWTHEYFKKYKNYMFHPFRKV